MKHGGNIWQLIRKGVKPEEIIDFSASINPFGPPEWIQDAVRNSMRFIRHYPDQLQEDLTARLSSFLGINKDYIIPGNGATEVIYLLANLLQKKNILIPSPTFTEYETASAINDAVLRFPQISESNGFGFPDEDVLSELPWSTAVWICNPNNPTGQLIEPAVMTVLLDNAAKTDTLVIADESFLLFCADYNRQTLLKKIDKYPNLIVISSLTKFFAVPGLRIGYLATSNAAILSKLKKQMPPWSVNIFVQEIVPAMLKDDGFITRSRGLVKEAGDRFFKGLSEIKTLRVYPSAANFFLIKLCGSMGADSLSQQLAEKNILIRSCSNFRGLDDTHIRVSVMRDRENRILAEALKIEDEVISPTVNGEP